jgi:hypothetical protein
MKIKDERFEQMLSRVRDRNGRLAKERCLYTREELCERMGNAARSAEDSSAERRRGWLRMALLVVLAVMPLAVAASVTVYRAQPEPDGYVMNIGADRAEMVVSIERVLINI